VNYTKSEHKPGGATVLVILYSTRHILLVKNLRDRRKPLWKFIAETVEPGEPVLNTLVAGTREEGGLELPAVWQGKVVTKVGSDDVVVKQVCPPEFLSEARTPHWRHLYKVRLSDDLLMSLHDKKHDADEDELMHTWAFELFEPEQMPDFLPQHLPLFQKFKYSD
jgi:ADP-ribose pyrophosphatase YjhB (NUDIX family)